MRFIVKVFKVFFLLIAGMQTGRYALMTNTGAMYFESPVKSVTIITDLLKSKNWSRLSQYYYLEKSGIEKSRLVSGEYFYQEIIPEGTHPGGFSRYRHPFAPGFVYDSERVENSDTVRVNLKIRIDQGGGMVQEGIACFKLHKSSRGYQVLPGTCNPWGK